MKKVILDTNVIVSALISNAYPTQILYELVLTKSVHLCISSEIFNEYVEVLGGEKFSRFSHFKAKADVVIFTLSEIATHYKTKKRLDILTDASDNKFLELAAESSADYIVTGNTQDFILTEFENTRILSPRDFWIEINLKR